jgi:vacuolar-type H+-ATPase subunit I/STV1
MTDELFELSSELFTGDEIDNMEAFQLDDLPAEDLKAYLDKIRRTLKEIRLEEQRWKQRTNRLLDMKEEAEALLEDL